MKAGTHLFLGLDIGSTTTSALLASAELLTQSVSGKKAWGNFKIQEEPEAIFTPFLKGELDLAALERQVFYWISQWGLKPEALTSTGAIVTGLAAESKNAATLLGWLTEKFQDSVLAATKDPRLESWLSFHGSCASLSKESPNRFFLNFDIGGGTTNLALGKAGKVIATSSFFLGARHFVYSPTPQTSAWGKLLENEAGTQPHALARVIVEKLESLTRGILPQEFLQTPWPMAVPNLSDCVFTFSGGVGELVYRYTAGTGPKEENPYGDLGCLLAKAILESPVLNKDLKKFHPANRGRATVVGVTLQQNFLAGATIFQSAGLTLPLRDIPLSEWARTQESFEGPRAFWVRGLKPESEAIQALANHLRPELSRSQAPLVILLETNCGKILGSVLSDWRPDFSQPLLILDELDYTDAQFVSVGQLAEGTVSVAFYGMQN